MSLQLCATYIYLIVTVEVWQREAWTEAIKLS